MIPSSQMQELLARTVLDRPFGAKELRRIKGMGEMYIALSPMSPNDEYVFVASVAVNQEQYRLFRRIT